MSSDTSANEQQDWSHLLGAGTQPPKEILANFVPMTDLSSTHLGSLARISKLVTLHGSQYLGDQDLLDQYYVYLVNGDLVATFCVTGQRVVYSAANFGMLSIGDFIENVRELSAASDAQILVVDRDELDSMLCWDQVAKSLALELSAERELDEDRDWLNTLLTSNLFHRIPPYNIRHVVDKFTARVVQSGEVIIREGDEGEECFIIKEGRASVTSMPPGASQPAVLAQLGAGQCFGEEALACRARRNASVTMETNGVLMALNKADFNSLMQEPVVEALEEGEAAALVSSGQATWLDVRSQQEYDHDHRANAFHLPLHLMSIKTRLMNNKFKYLAYCSTGRRAATAARLLKQQGFDVVAVAAPDY
ncbi:MAG: cyclic nucleotide-binding domain-containing protein [Pseudomonadales bacterium]|nr:cyclic nucleotide-binding domain-containing protein [Pseudomonadales bacterium]